MSRVIVIAFCVSALSPAETPARAASGAHPATLASFPDTATSSAGTDSSRVGYHPSKSTTLAMVLSAALPGAGQAYNGSYWKIPVIAGFVVYFGSEWLDNNRRYHDYRDRYSAALQNPAADPYSLVQLQSARDFYRQQRDTFTWYLAIVYGLNILDAYVDASLHDFDVSGNLSMRAMPGTDPAGGNELRLQFSFTLH